MTIPSTNTGLSDLAAAYGAPPGPVRLSQFYKNGAFLPPKAPDNPSQDLSPGIPTAGALQLSQFHGANAGFGAIQPAGGQNVEMAEFFGADWDNDVAKLLVIPSGTQIGQLTVNGGNGSRKILIDGEIQGVGGNPAGDGAAALFLIGTQGPSAVEIVNNGAIRGGGGGGGTGGLGGTGGPGSYLGLETQGPFFVNTPPASSTVDPGDYFMAYLSAAGSPQRSTFVWNGVLVADLAFSDVSTYLAADGWTYQRGALQATSGTLQTFKISRSRDGIVLTAGGAGGAPGFGGHGQGYGQTATAGSVGGSGAAGGTNAGAGGSGGVGGAGGSWGQEGLVGNLGNTGGAGNEGAGAAGGDAAFDRGAGGNAVYATVSWSITGSGVVDGDTGPISAA